MMHMLKINDSSAWGNSYRNIDVKVPIWLDDTTINSGESKINLEQTIWIDAGLYQDVKSKEVFVELKTDYHNVTFNNAQGVLIKRDDKFDLFSRQQRKQFGVGLQLGIGFTDKVTPYVGLGVQYSPKFLQW